MCLFYTVKDRNKEEKIIPLPASFSGGERVRRSRRVRGYPAQEILDHERFIQYPPPLRVAA